MRINGLLLPKSLRRASEGFGIMIFETMELEEGFSGTAENPMARVALSVMNRQAGMNFILISYVELVFLIAIVTGLDLCANDAYGKFRGSML